MYHVQKIDDKQVRLAIKIAKLRGRLKAPKTDAAQIYQQTKEAKKALKELGMELLAVDEFLRDISGAEQFLEITARNKQDYYIERAQRRAVRRFDTPLWVDEDTGEALS